MRALVVVLTIASTLYTVQCFKSKSYLYHCERHKFYNETSSKCAVCDLCGPGTFVKSKCKGFRDTQCRNCEPGYFSTAYSKSPNTCHRCTDCGLRKVIKPCTSTSDAECGDCPLGTYWDYVKYSCTQCSYCFPEYGDEIAIEPSCENPSIPATHRCVEASWAPYKPPRLISQVTKEGDLVFISSKDVEPSRSMAADTKASETIPADVRSTAAEKTLSRFVYSTKDSTAFMDKILSKFAKVYDTHCTRTLIVATVFCLCVLFVALICVFARKRPQLSTSDAKALLENVA